MLLRPLGSVKREAGGWAFQTQILPTPKRRVPHLFRVLCGKVGDEDPVCPHILFHPLSFRAKRGICFLQCDALREGILNHTQKKGAPSFRVLCGKVGDENLDHKRSIHLGAGMRPVVGRDRSAHS